MSNHALNQELERIRSYIYTIQRSINETNTVSQSLKEDLETLRDHQQQNYESKTIEKKRNNFLIRILIYCRLSDFDFDQMLQQCWEKSNEIQ